MKKYLIAALLSSLFALQAQHNLFERFDAVPCKGYLSSGGAIDLKAGVEKGALTARGNKKNFQYIYSYKFPVVAGEKYSVTFNVRTSGNTGFWAMLIFEAEKGKFEVFIDNSSKTDNKAVFTLI